MGTPAIYSRKGGLPRYPPKKRGTRGIFAGCDTAGEPHVIAHAPQDGESWGKQLRSLSHALYWLSQALHWPSDALHLLNPGGWRR